MTLCAICNGKNGEHSLWCTRLVYSPDERRPPQTSAERYSHVSFPSHEEGQHRAAYGRADADVAPTEARPLIRTAVTPEACHGDCTHSPAGWWHKPECPMFTGNTIKRCPDCEAEPWQQHAKNCPSDLNRTVEDLRTARERSEDRETAKRFDAMTLPEASETAQEGLNPKDLIGCTKTPLGLLPWTALVQVAKVFAVGAKKYGAYNWRTKGQPVQHVTYVEAAFRHLAAYMDGQTIDPETGCNHLAHAACGLLILLDASAVGNSIDNRPIPGTAAEIMALKD